MSDDSPYTPDASIALLLTRYAAREADGTSTATDQVAIDRWIDDRAERRAYVESLVAVARLARAVPGPFNPQSAWASAADRLGLSERGAESRRLVVHDQALAGAQVDRGGYHHQRLQGVGQGRSPWWPRKQTTAGILAALGVGMVVVGLVASRATEHVSHRVTQDWAYTTTAGQRETVMLPDGTEFTLAPGSRLRLEGDYGAGSRNVDLDGEAAFSVTHDGTRPFAVHASGVVATDLGTRFVVRAYPDEAMSHVMVAEGRVTVRPAASRGQPRTGRREQLLAPRDVAEIDATGSITALRHVDPDAYFGWTVGRLVFSDATLAAVARDLTRWYGIPIEIRDPALREQQLVITLDRQPADVAVTLVAAAVGAHVRRVGAGYILTSSRP